MGHLKMKGLEALEINAKATIKSLHDFYFVTFNFSRSSCFSLTELKASLNL
jgi:hypothetical protein